MHLVTNEISFIIIRMFMQKGVELGVYHALLDTSEIFIYYELTSGQHSCIVTYVSIHAFLEL